MYVKLLKLKSSVEDKVNKVYFLFLGNTISVEVENLKKARGFNVD